MKDKCDKTYDYEKIQEQLDIRIAQIKNKIIGLYSQLSRDIAKTNQKKSGQGVSENYKSSWIYWDRLQFLIPVIRACFDKTGFKMIYAVWPLCKT